MQGEAVFVYKLLGIIAGGWAHYYFIIKTIILLRERQSVTFKRVEKMIVDYEGITKQLTVLQTQHNERTCERGRRK